MNPTDIDQPALDFSSCDREPIRTPGGIQAHGFLLALHKGVIVQVSENVIEHLGKLPGSLLGTSLENAVGHQNAQQLLRSQGKDNSGKLVYLGPIRLGDRWFDSLMHHHDELDIFDFEQVEAGDEADFQLLYSFLNRFMKALTDTDSVQAMSALAAKEIKQITGYGRVLVYRFDEKGHGNTIAEARDTDYHSYLNQRFPASDIPRQARDLYVANHIRLISNASYRPSGLVPFNNPITGNPVDLTFSTLRSVSPVHLQYMQNMGTGASMSISLIVKGELWGLISCHNTESKFIPFKIRAACEQLGQILALRISSKEENDESQYRLELRRILVSILSHLGQEGDFIDNLTMASPELLQFASASGAAMVFENKVVRFGDAPAEKNIRALVKWLGNYPHDQVFHTDNLANAYPDAASVRSIASGVLALPISRIHPHYLIWFRPEVIQTIDWAGSPHAKTSGAATVHALSPRTSFDVWRETVHGFSIPWRSSEIETAVEFRTALLSLVLERAEQMAELAEELTQVNKELESFSYTVSHDLRAPLRHIAGYSDLLLEFEEAHLSERSIRFLRNIKDSAKFAGSLVDGLLSFSQMARASLRPSDVDMNQLVKECINKLSDELHERVIQWEVEDLPVVQADPMLLYLALYNLLSNAVKYTRQTSHPLVKVNAEIEDGRYIFHVKDNGVGFNAEYKHKLFGVFQRLHRMEDFEGTGIGLANVRRIIERHGGQAWADSAPGEGAVFSFSLPKELALE